MNIAPSTMSKAFPRACLAVPSWVIPGTYLDNLRFLADKPQVRGVELLFFIYDRGIAAQLRDEWAGIGGYAGRFVFTAHLPDPLLPAHEELVALLDPLVRHFIVHPGAPENAPALGALVNSWAEKYPSPLSAPPLNAPLQETAAPETRVPSRRFLAENTNPGMFEALLPHLSGKAGICMDTGHLLLDGKSPAAFFREHRDRIDEIHLHGLDREKAALDGRLPDHRPVREGDPWLGELLPLLKGFAGVINTEVFSWEEAERGINSVIHYVQSME
jgi:hypothetical protein